MKTSSRIQIVIAAAALTTACTSTGRGASTVDASANLAVSATDELPPIENAASEAYSFEVAFMTHLDMNLPEQDVYIERVPGSGEVFRVTKGDNDMSAALYKTAVEVKHDPFDPKALGPHPRGEAFGMTLGEWLAHQGAGVYSYEDGVGTLDLTFSGLVPNGVYTMWHGFIALPPTTPFSGTLDLPLGARDGSTSVFTADESGNAKFQHTFTPGLEMSDVWTTAMLAINYHSDGRTYGGLPGNFGLNAHIPLFVMLPNRDGIQ